VFSKNFNTLYADDHIVVCICPIAFAGVRDWYSFHRYAINFAYLEVS